MEDSPNKATKLEVGETSKTKSKVSRKRSTKNTQGLQGQSSSQNEIREIPVVKTLEDVIVLPVQRQILRSNGIQTVEDLGKKLRSEGWVEVHGFVFDVNPKKTTTVRRRKKLTKLEKLMLDELRDRFDSRESSPIRLVAKSTPLSPSQPQSDNSSIASTPTKSVTAAIDKDFFDLSSAPSTPNISQDPVSPIQDLSVQMASLSPCDGVCTRSRYKKLLEKNRNEIRTT